MGVTGSLVVNGILTWFSGFTILKELKEIIRHPHDLKENYHLFNEFITFDGKWIQPKHKWGGRKPKIGVMVDDAQSTKIFRNRHFLNLCEVCHRRKAKASESSPGASIRLTSETCDGLPNLGADSADDDTGDQPFQLDGHR